ncbi:hypothetical protein LCGC14_1864740 [marine sediment metagenome]|uniref:Uncharacterized protein n=1 Tax=marine sediment metagenome TaxID=412755 RepID=A0A0F9GUU0_9ZZZZ
MPTKKEFIAAYFENMSEDDIKNAMWNDYQRITELRTKLTHYEALRKAARELIKDPGFHTEDKLREALTALEAQDGMD